MTAQVETVMQEHAALAVGVAELVSIARELPRLHPDQRRERRARAAGFVNDVLVPHAREEERGLYRRVGLVLGHPEATAPMVYDHLAIREWAARLTETDEHEVDRLQELLYGLHALIVEHFRKEEELYQPLLERSEALDELIGYDARALTHEP